MVLVGRRDLKNATLWDLTEGYPSPIPLPHRGRFRRRRFGRRIGLCHLWYSLHDPHLERNHSRAGKAMRHGGQVAGVAWSPDGKYLATTGHD